MSPAAVQLNAWLCVCVLVCLQELYGDDVGGAMLNALSRLFTARLQATGFTCGMDDLLLTPAAEAQRSQVGSCCCQRFVLCSLCRTVSLMPACVLLYVHLLSDFMLCFTHCSAAVCSSCCTCHGGVCLWLWRLQCFCCCVVYNQVLGKAEAAALAGSAEVVRSRLVTAGAVASGQVPVHLAQKPGGKVSGLLNAERLMVAKQLEQHFSMNGAATGAVLDSKVTGEKLLPTAVAAVERVALTAVVLAALWQGSITCMHACL